MKNWFVSALVMGALVSPVAFAQDGEEHAVKEDQAVEMKADQAAEARIEKKVEGKEADAAPQKQHKKKHRAKKKHAKKKCHKKHHAQAEHETAAEHKIDEETGKTNR